MGFDSQSQLEVGVEPAEELPTEQVTLTGNKSADHQNERDDRETEYLGTGKFVDDVSAVIESWTEQQTLD